MTLPIFRDESLVLPKVKRNLGCTGAGVPLLISCLLVLPHFLFNPPQLHHLCYSQVRLLTMPEAHDVRACDVQFLLPYLFSSLLLINFLNHLVEAEFGTSYSVSRATSTSLNYNTTLFYNCWFACLMSWKTRCLCHPRAYGRVEKMHLKVQG